MDKNKIKHNANSILTTTTVLHVAWRRFTEAKVVIFSQRLVSHAKPHQQDKNKRLKSSTHSSTAAASTQSYSYNSSSNYVASVQQEMWSFYHMWSLYCQSICLWHSSTRNITGKAKKHKLTNGGRRTISTHGLVYYRLLLLMLLYT